MLMCHLHTIPAITAAEPTLPRCMLMMLFNNRM